MRRVATGDVPPEVAERSKLKKLPETEDAAKEKDEAVQQSDAESGRRTVYTTTFYIGLKIEPRQAHEGPTRRLDISYPTMDFTQKVKQWDQFDEAAMGIVVRHIKGYVLRYSPKISSPRLCLRWRYAAS